MQYFETPLIRFTNFSHPYQIDREWYITLSTRDKTESFDLWIDKNYLQVVQAGFHPSDELIQNLSKGVLFYGMQEHLLQIQMVNLGPDNRASLEIWYNGHLQKRVATWHGLALAIALQTEVVCKQEELDELLESMFQHSLEHSSTALLRWSLPHLQAQANPNSSLSIIRRREMERREKKVLQELRDRIERPKAIQNLLGMLVAHLRG